MTLTTDMVSAVEHPIPLERAYSSGEDGIVLYPEEYCLELHVSGQDPSDTMRGFLDRDRINTALGQVAAYLDLRKEWFGARHIIGVTHHSMARIAVRHFGFTHLDVPRNYFSIDDIYTLKFDFSSEPHLVVMDTGTFMDRFGGDQPTTDTKVAAQLANLRDAAAGFLPVDEIGTEVAFASITDVVREESNNYIARLNPERPEIVI